MSFLRTKADILIPAKRHKLIPCGHCRGVIDLKYQPKRQLLIKHKKPICIGCLETKFGKNARQINRDRKKAVKDWDEAKANERKQESKRLEKMARKNAPVKL